MLLFKIGLAPVLIALVSLAGRKWGPGVSGWLLGIPFNAGPVLLFLALEEGPQFASRTAIGSLMGVVPWAIFALVYAHACLRLPWWASTLFGWSIYFLVAALLRKVVLGLVLVFVLVCISLALIISGFPKVAKPQLPTSYHRYDLCLRMFMATFLILTLTAFAKPLGPTTSGIFSAFPALTTILAIFNHQHRPEAAVHVLKGVVTGLYTAATFLLVLSPALLHFPIAGAFAFAITAGLLVQGLSLVYLRQKSA